MEANFGGKTHHSYGPVVPNLKALGKKSMDWDSNDWKWDGDLFTATPLNSLPSDCRSRQFFKVGSEIPTYGSPFCSDEISLRNGLENRELDKRRRAVVDEDEELNNEAGSLNLKLGGQVYPITEAEMEKWKGKSGKKSKVTESTSYRAVCQVEDCRADLTYAKDYHRRHKVCEVHSKVSRALVGNVMQRFCQQCSRFHVLEEFDEGKRSCRRRLAGHNRRRRKTHPENMVNGGSLTDERSSSYLLVSLLRILSNMHTNSSDQMKDQDFLSHLLRNLASSYNGGSMPAAVRGSQDLLNPGTSSGTAEKDPLKPNGLCASATLPAFEGIGKRSSMDDAIPCPTRGKIAAKASQEIAERKMKISNIDLNNVYDDSQDCTENLGSCHASATCRSGSPDCTVWGHRDRQKSSAPQTTWNSGSLSTQSPSSSSGEAQCRTDRIVFKLFGKDPSDFPLVLRKQILDWLSNSPTDIESYIRPGCIILTIYLRLGKSAWEELCCDMSSSLTKLLDASNDSFWKMGWVYTRLLHHLVFIHNGRVVLDTMLPLNSYKNCRILSIKPIAVSVSKRAQFVIKGFNLSQSSTRLLCALEGKYLVQETCSNIVGECDTFVDHVEVQCLSFSCLIPNVTGRGFIEVEDQSLNSSFFPFIVAEQDVCSEICSLECSIENAEVPDDIQASESGIIKARDDALEFVHEMGWLLHRTQLKFRLGSSDPNSVLFPFKRFKWLVEYSIEHDWCAVVKKLLGILFNGVVDAGDYSSIELALLDMGLLHKAVRRNCRSMVENLLKYVPEGYLDKFNGEKQQNVKGGSKFIFRPDASGPGGFTPLHIAASKDGSESVLDALTDDPGSVGIEAWRVVRDNTGLTPNDYASLRGYYSYIRLIQKKIDKMSTNGHVVLDIKKPTTPHKSTRVACFHTEKNKMKQINQLNCKLCERKMTFANSRTSLAIYRPAMLSMVAIAAVCVCAALLFKSSPEVIYVFPFRWELLAYGWS